MSKFVFSAIFASCLWGLTGVCGRFMEAGGMSSEEINMIRFMLSALLFGIASFKKNPRSLLIRVCDIWVFLGSGVLGLFLFSYFYFRGMALLPLSVVSVFGATTPLFVLVLSYFLFKEKLTLKKLLSCNCICWLFPNNRGPQRKYSSFRRYCCRIVHWPF